MKVSMRRFWDSIVSLWFVFAVRQPAWRRARPWPRTCPDFRKNAASSLLPRRARRRWTAVVPAGCLRSDIFVWQGRGHRRFSNYDYGDTVVLVEFTAFSFNGEDRFGRRRAVDSFVTASITYLSVSLPNSLLIS